MTTSSTAASPGWAAAEPAMPARPEAAGYFEYHGVWAPGVRLFRALGFRAKALIISIIFVVPIVTLGWDVQRSSNASIDFSARERLGVAYAREVMPLLKHAQLERLYALQAAATGKTAPEQAQAAAAVAAQFKKVEAVDRATGAALGTGAALAAAMDASRVPHADSIDKVFAAHSRHADAVLALLGQAADGSNLTLDPDLDTFYLMDGAFNALPALVESIAQMRGLAAAVAASGKAATGETSRVLAGAEAVGDLTDARLEGALKKVYGVHPEYELAFGSKDAIAAMHAFHELTHDPKADAATLVAKGTAVIDGLLAVQDRMLVRLDELLVARVAAQATHRNLLLGASAVLLALAGYLFYAFFLVTHGGLNEVRRHLEAMTAGDLTTNPQPWGSDEAAMLMLTLRDMQASLRDIVARVRGSSDSIVHASSEIAAASMDLSQRTEHTAANLEESSSSMEQISSTVQQTADSSRQAAAVADANAGVAERGGRVISQVVTTMQEIHASSNKISDIIGVIDGIAFQTNILALNASVEAARAGEQGRGFAVVAGEVRSLAQRSAQAAREIKTLITSSVEKVESGTKVVHGAGETMKELVANAARMRGLLSEISTAASEQSAGVNQVGSSVQDLDRMTQQNAALVEQTAAAASGLKDQAIGLAAQVAKFRLPGNTLG